MRLGQNLPRSVGGTWFGARQLEQFFRLDSQALGRARARRRPATRLGWAVQWGTVRMLGTFLTDDPTAVPAGVVRFVAEQLGEDRAQFPGYAVRQQTAYEHAWEIRDTYGYRDFADGESDLREFLAARVWSSLEGPRALFDRAVVWLIDNRVLLPGITTLARAVGGIRQEENERLYAALYEAVPHGLRTGLARLLEVPGNRRVSRDRRSAERDAGGGGADAVADRLRPRVHPAPPVPARGPGPGRRHVDLRGAHLLRR